jgi:membrane protease YdiL (CAAX protease family)
MSAQWWVDPRTGYTFSPDGRYWWNGLGWVAVLAAPAPAPSEQQRYAAEVAAAVEGRYRQWTVAAALAVVWLAISEFGPELLTNAHIHLGFVGGTIFLFTVNIGLGAGALLALRLAGVDHPWRRLGVGRPALRDLWLVPGWALLNFFARAFIAYALLAAIPDLRHSFVTNNPIEGAKFSAVVVVVLIAGGIIAPVVEELLFRGLLLRAITARYGFAIGAIVSSLLFGLAHAYEEPTWGGVLLIVSLMTTFGVLQCLLVRKTGRLATTIAVHMLSNLGVFAIGLLR